MGTFHAEVTLLDLTEQRRLTLDALVDTGATYVTVPASQLSALGIEPTERRTFVLADGRRAEYDIGFAMVSLDCRRAPTLVVFGDEGSAPLLGAVALESLGLAVDPVARRLIPVAGYLLLLQ